MEELRALRDKAETQKVEMTSKDRRNSELEQAVHRVKGEVQELLKELAVEVEKNAKLSSELQEERGGKQVRDNAQLCGEEATTGYVV